MKVLDLQCAQAHVFEGWFASEDDFRSQQADAQIRCPLCGDGNVSKRLSAPRLNLGVRSVTKPVDESVADSAAFDTAKALQQHWLLACRHLIDNTVDVGTRFADETRKIHYGEAAERAIRGRATRQEAQTLLDEGISVISVLIPDELTGPLQ